MKPLKSVNPTQKCGHRHKGNNRISKALFYGESVLTGLALLFRGTQISQAPKMKKLMRHCDQSVGGNLKSNYYYCCLLNGWHSRDILEHSGTSEVLNKTCSIDSLGDDFFINKGICPSAIFYDSAMNIILEGYWNRGMLDRLKGPALTYYN